jgi:hypothetical protein
MRRHVGSVPSPSRTLPNAAGKSNFSRSRAGFGPSEKVASRSKNCGAMLRWRSSLERRCERPRSRRTLLGATGDGRGRGVCGVVERRFGDHTGPRIEDERCAIGRRLVGAQPGHVVRGRGSPPWLHPRRFAALPFLLSTASTAGSSDGCDLSRAPRRSVRDRGSPPWLRAAGATCCVIITAIQPLRARKGCIAQTEDRGR